MGGQVARPYDFTSIIDGAPIVAYHCRQCQDEIEEANAEYQEKPHVDWKAIFGE